jgi:ABC-type nitrate/sulfonate/bicarbonate transport system substrate-binding protein
MPGAGYFCNKDSPPEIVEALQRGIVSWRAWCVKNPTRIAEALRLIYPQHEVYREIALEELRFYEAGQASATSKTANSFSKWAIWIAIASLIVAIASLIVTAFH